MSGRHQACSCCLRVEAELAANELAELLGGLSRLEADIEIDGGLDVTVAKDPAHVFVITGFGPEDQCCCRVPELMHGDEESRRLLNALGDLVASRAHALVLTLRAGKQPRLVGAAQQYV